MFIDKQYVVLKEIMQIDFQQGGFHWESPEICHPD